MSTLCNREATRIHRSTIIEQDVWAVLYSWTASRCLAATGSERAQYAFKLLFGVLAPHQVGRHERPSVDHGVIRSVVPLVEDDGVESVAAGFYPDVFEDVVSSVSHQSKTVDEHFYRSRFCGCRTGVIRALGCGRLGTPSGKFG